MMIKEIFTSKKQSYSDQQVVEGLQNRDRRIEEWFYKAAKRYFDNCFNKVFFDQDKRQEIFQTAFLKLWTEISNGRISIQEQRICRQQKNGENKPMTCSLTTFLMAFARTEYRELVRNIHEEYYDVLFDNAENAEVQTHLFEKAEDVVEQKNQIVDECIGELSPRCAEILTLFYYKGMSLDEIMEIRSDKNQSKNGLKTAKNKCMNTLRERITNQFMMYHLTA